MADRVLGNPIPYKNRDSFAGLREAKQRQRENIQPIPVPANLNAAPVTRKRPAENNYGSMATQGQNITPVCMITPYINKYVINLVLITEFRWRICGVIKGKESVREIKSARGPSKVFSFQLMDSAGGLIKICCFGDQADRFNAILHNDQVILTAKQF